MATQLSRLVEYTGSTILEKAVGGAATGTIRTVTGDDSTRVKFKDINKNVTLIPKGSGVIDIVNDFDWNANQVLTAYPKMPKIYLTERRQIESSLISSYYYYSTNINRILDNLGASSGGAFTSIGDVQGQIIDKVREFTLKAAKSTTSTFDSFFGTSATSGIFDGGYKSIANFTKFIATIREEISNLAQSDQAVLGEYLKSYLGIYLTRETGFFYVLPYFENNFQDITNSWSRLDRASPLHNVVDQAANAIMPYFKPGVYIERPKFFEFQSNEGDSVTVTFPLLNTTSNTYKKNYEFLWMLAFQNKYYRESFASVRPSSIYTVQIPGVKYFPYAYISKLTIDFVGTRRLLPVETPIGTVDAPVPDAYQVSLTLRSLLSDSANTMLADQFYRQIRTKIQ
jgi:hypothetical protein